LEVKLDSSGLPAEWSRHCTKRALPLALPTPTKKATSAEKTTKMYGGRTEKNEFKGAAS